MRKSDMAATLDGLSVYDSKLLQRNHACFPCKTIVALVFVLVEGISAWAYTSSGRLCTCTLLLRWKETMKPMDTKVRGDKQKTQLQMMVEKIPDSALVSHH
jgi:hypothetical protein